MSEEPKRRLLDRIGSSPTYIAEGTQIVGDIDCKGPLIISGQVRGKGQVAGALSMTTSAVWDGDLTARSAVVAGRVTGALTVADKLEISATAVITGPVTTPSLAIANGAIVEGDVVVTSGKPIVKFDEKRVTTSEIE
ncbi:MAG: polymer-forming cytoskeletal protein [Proteobacteria bacterium]|jgi:cytoskeletal protein CcmA (bactofilin family)|nr:polymer-forming cytoskeletal protein [Pseudomonadota bacterium]